MTAIEIPEPSIRETTKLSGQKTRESIDPVQKRGKKVRYLMIRRAWTLSGIWEKIWPGC